MIVLPETRIPKLLNCVHLATCTSTHASGSFAISRLDTSVRSVSPIHLSLLTLNIADISYGSGLLIYTNIKDSGQTLGIEIDATARPKPVVLVASLD